MENAIRLKTAAVTKRIRVISTIVMTALCVILFVLTAVTRPAYLRAETYRGPETVPLSRARFASRSHLYYTGGERYGGFRIRSDAGGYLSDKDAEYAFLYKGQLLAFDYQLELLSSNQRGPIRVRLTSVSSSVPGSVDFTVYPKGAHYTAKALEWWIPAALLGIAACAALYVIPAGAVKKNGILEISGMPDEVRRNVEYLITDKRTENGYEPIYKYYLDRILPDYKITEEQVRAKIAEHARQSMTIGKMMIAAALLVGLPFIAINLGYLPDLPGTFILALLILGGLIAGGVILNRKEAKRNAK